jgi:hypothetical protein
VNIVNFTPTKKFVDFVARKALGWHKDRYRVDWKYNRQFTHWHVWYVDTDITSTTFHPFAVYEADLAVLRAVNLWVAGKYQFCEQLFNIWKQRGNATDYPARWRYDITHDVTLYQPGDYSLAAALACGYEIPQYSKPKKLQKDSINDTFLRRYPVSLGASIDD